MRKGLKAVLKRQGRTRKPGNKEILVNLASPRQERGGDRNADAPSEVAHQIDHCRPVIHFVGRQAVESECIDGNEKKSDTNGLIDAGDRDAP